jgi:ferric-dicitrate binding protein FerR (iron transport regulator)
MHNQQQNRPDGPIRFVAKHYREGRFRADKAWAKFAAANDLRPAIPLRRYLWVAAAAVLLLIVGGTFFYRKQTAPDWITVSTAAGQRKDVLLPDSTRIAMAENSWIRYSKTAYGKTRREVEMNGKAFFDITPDKAHPFTVHADATETVALGTSFQIACRDTAVKLSVTSGKVGFRAGNKTEHIILTAGMSAHYTMETQAIQVLKEDNPNYLSWKTGVLRFHNLPLEEVVKELSRHYQTPVRSKSTIRGEKLTATFDNLPLDEVLLIIYHTLDVRLVADKTPPQP